MKRRDPFQAIADPTRRSIISMVAKESLNLNSVAERFNVSRPAISKHIKILTQCGLITIRQKGRERFCEAQLEGLNDISIWLADYKQFWGIKQDDQQGYVAEVEEEKQVIMSEVAVIPEAVIAPETVAEAQSPAEPIAAEPEEIKTPAPRKAKKKADVPDTSIQQGSLFG